MQSNLTLSCRISRHWSGSCIGRKDKEGNSCDKVLVEFLYSLGMAHTGEPLYKEHSE